MPPRAPKKSDPPPRIEIPDTEPLPPIEDLVEDDPDYGDLLALSDAEYSDATWYVWRQQIPGDPMPRRPYGNAPTYLAMLTGPLNLEAIRQQVGGGFFRVQGWRKKHCFKRFTINFEGPRKEFAVDAVRDPLVTSSVTSPGDPSVQAAILRQLDSIERRLNERTAAVTPAAPAKDPVELAIMLAKVIRSGEGVQGSPDKVVVDAMLGMLKEGISLGQGREPDQAPRGTDWAAVIEKAMPLVDRVVTAMSARAMQMRYERARSAEVVDETQSQPLDAAGIRMTAVIDALARAVADEIPPEDFADSMIHMLEPQELAMLKITTADQAMADLAGVIKRYPILSTPLAREYIAQVLAELNRPSVGEDEPLGDEPEDEPEGEGL